MAFARATDGDQAAWGLIVRNYAGRVWAVARGFRLSDADAADVFQTTWLRLVENLTQIRDGHGLGSWLATTARREAMDMLRRRAREAVVDTADGIELVDSAEPPDAPVLRADQDRRLWEAVFRLPPRCFRLLRVMSADPPPSYAEVAAALDLPVGSIGPTRARCLRALRDLLGDDWRAA